MSPQKSPKQPMVAISVLHWGSKQDTIDAYQSLLKLSYDNFQIFVVDQVGNLLATEFKRAKLIKPPSNLGFAGGNNLVIERALQDNFDYVLLFNNDATAKIDLLDRLIQVMHNNPKVAAVSPTIITSRPSDTIWYGGGKLSLVFGSSHHNFVGQRIGAVADLQPQPTQFSSGGCMLISSEALQKVGLLEEKYFVYWEDTDWSARATKASYQLWWDPNAIVTHKVSQSLGVNSPNYLYYYFRNRLIFIHRNVSVLWRWLARLSFEKALAKEKLKLYLRPNVKTRECLSMLQRAKADYKSGHWGQL